MTSPISAALAAVVKDAPAREVAEAIKDIVRQYGAAMTPVDALRFSREIRDGAVERYKELSAAIIASVNGEPGSYPGFMVVDISGRASVNTTALHDKYPDAYEDVVTWSAPYKSVRLSGSDYLTDSGSS
ncbi:MAG: hypothetical protein E6R04_03200 [Spirochaetes bacterium]|nr:MAG: hypothetical protein E6R04_03200 [Spirochaetota bacterium]